MLKILCLLFNIGMFIWVVDWVIVKHLWPLPFVTFVYMAATIYTLVYVSRTQGFAPESFISAWLERVTLEEKLKIKKLKQRLAAGK